MKRQIAIGAAVAAATILTGCAAGSPQPAATVTVTAPAAASARATPSPTATTVHPLGEWVTIGNVRMRALEARQKDSSTYDRTADRGVLVEACVDSGSHTFGWHDFIGADAEKGQYPAASSTYSDYPRPMFPFSEQQVTAGGCVKGWVLFPTNEETQLAYVGWGSTSGGAAVWGLA